MTNFSTLKQGTWGDRESTTRVDVRASAATDMGAVTKFVAASGSGDIIARAGPNAGTTDPFWGIAVEGGVTGGVYGTGAASTDDTTRAATTAGEGMTICTQGLTPAKVSGNITVGQKLTNGAGDQLVAATTGDEVVAVAAQATGGVGDHIIVVDVQRGRASA